VNFNSILIGSEDPKRLVDYYTGLLGKPTMADDNYAGWEIGSGWLTIGAHDQVHGKNPQPGRLLWNIESADVRGDFERFKEAGAIVIREPYALGEENVQGTIATFADPDDNYFQLMSPMEMETPA
jgi:predicted enzyme related to lactoylglutathione lyase